MNKQDFIARLVASLDLDAIEQIVDSKPYIKEAAPYMMQGVVKAIAWTVNEHIDLIAGVAERNAIIAHFEDWKKEAMQVA